MQESEYRSVKGIYVDSDKVPRTSALKILRVRYLERGERTARKRWGQGENARDRERQGGQEASCGAGVTVGAETIQRAMAQ